MKTPFMQLRTAREQGALILRKAGVPSPCLTADVLLMHAAKCDRAYLHAHGERDLTEIEWIHYGRYLNERLSGKPVQYITGLQEFWGLEFLVDPSVLIPRPETELVVEATVEIARRHYDTTEGLQIADMGTGSGCIAVALAKEFPRAAVYALDRSPEALVVARRNAERFAMGNIRFFVSDLLNCISNDALPRFDIIVSNPPYIGENDVGSVERQVLDFEPREALIAGPTGTEIYDRLIDQAARALRPGGYLVLELGYNSEEWMRARLKRDFWTEVGWLCDLAGITRVVTARRASGEKAAGPHRP